jgi:hypothetical protein
MVTHQREVLLLRPSIYARLTQLFVRFSDLARNQSENLYRLLHTSLIQALYLDPLAMIGDKASSGATVPSLPEITKPNRSIAQEKALKRILKVPVPQAILVSLFSWDGVMEGLGKMNLSKSNITLIISSQDGSDARK